MRNVAEQPVLKVVPPGLPAREEEQPACQELPVLPEVAQVSDVQEHVHLVFWQCFKSNIHLQCRTIIKVTYNQSSPFRPDNKLTIF